MESRQFEYEGETDEQMELFDHYNDKIVALKTPTLTQQIDEWQTSYFVERLEAMIHSDLKGEEEHGQLHVMTRLHHFFTTTSSQHMLMLLPNEKIMGVDMAKYGEINKVLDLIKEVMDDTILSAGQKYRLRERLEHIGESKPFQAYIKQLGDASKDYFLTGNKRNTEVESKTKGTQTIGQRARAILGRWGK
ncbi:MAG: hypothetical protein U0518_05690 [Candidatus Gracilibacteria bacterium]